MYNEDKDPKEQQKQVDNQRKEFSKLTSKYFEKRIKRRLFWDAVQNCISFIFWTTVVIILFLALLDIIGIADIFPIL